MEFVAEGSSKGCIKLLKHKEVVKFEARGSSKGCIKL